MRLWLGLIFLIVYASPASATIGERILIGENKGLTVSIAQDFVCAPEMTVSVNALDKQVFDDEYQYLQSVASALPSILSAECGDSVTLQTVGMYGTVGREPVYYWTVTAANNWDLNKSKWAIVVSAPMPKEDTNTSQIQQESPAPIIVSATMPKSENADGESKNVPAIGAPIIVSVPAPPVVDTAVIQPVIQPQPAYTPPVSQDYDTSDNPYETNAVSAFAIAFINSGAMLEFGDEIYCSVLSWASGESGGIFGTQTFKDCRYYTQRKIAYIEKHHSTTALVGLLLGYILLAPAALMYYLFYAKKKNPTPKDIFKSTFKLELGEGAVCVVGQVMTDGNLKMALLSLGIGCASGVIRGGGLSIMEKCRIDVGFKYALTFWIVVAVFGMIYLFGMSSPAHAGGAGGFLTNAFENAARHEAPVIVRETLSETFNNKATIEAVSGIDNAASRGTHATTDATSREAMEKSNREAVERTNREAAERVEKEAQDKAAREEAARVQQKSDEAARIAREQQEKTAREEADRLAKIDWEQKQAADAARIAKEQQERAAREEADRIARQDWENKRLEQQQWDEKQAAIVAKKEVSFDTIAVDSKGNALPLKKGEYLTGSPDGKWIQVRNSDGSPNGMRIDGGHSPSTHHDPRALKAHAHVPGKTNKDGTPWLPIRD
jgi:flagellar biosynthesis GTPase FlhF